MSDSPNKSNASNALKALDCIDRRTAIEWVENIWIIETYYHPYAKRRIVSLDEVIDTLKRVPSAPQEIIRCKDCKYCEKTNRNSLSSCAGYECKIKPHKRKMKRCCWCYFGHINFSH